MIKDKFNVIIVFLFFVLNFYDSGKSFVNVYSYTGGVIVDVVNLCFGYLLAITMIKILLRLLRV